jgi:hypothetical protein
MLYGLYILSCFGSGVLEVRTKSIDWAQLSRILLKDEERDLSLKHCFQTKKEGGR